eukprot:749190-Hanusia_phi.AAC.1
MAPATIVSPTMMNRATRFITDDKYFSLSRSRAPYARTFRVTQGIRSCGSGSSAGPASRRTAQPGFRITVSCHDARP